ncbi:glycoside hydrolase family 30 beta sandwich domain-containing protein [Aeoliella mucimassa]|uniref:Glycosyl hydrolase family 30 beta sandwich domain-containing protein n=1 Tax=Aeoliella mucimassa TaxID=2527972 RepID=A0A518AR88_9BACT|nr:glycoside hydrolase family 30 beta sandwich domain-containing protein [Aeoliella mucimassa]QDU57230.1 hypothetical protein Pan181_34440 [Aeoliella mucimassa]
MELCSLIEQVSVRCALRNDLASKHWWMWFIGGWLVVMSIGPAQAKYPVLRPMRENPAPTTGRYVVHVDQPQQLVWGMGFEIQCDSIRSGNQGLPEERTSVPRDLVPEERDRLANEMLSGFRYCRLAGGLYWRGTDDDQKVLKPRWPNQLEELQALLDNAGVEGLSFEYWTPPPFWKANRNYVDTQDGKNILRCYGRQFANDPVYHGDVKRFLRDFADARVQDIQTLKNAGFRIDQWGLSNEPWVNNAYSTCYYTKEQYGEVFKAVAPAIRDHDPSIKIIADTMYGSPQYIAPVMRTEYAKYVDALVVHAIGEDSAIVPKIVRETRNSISQPLPLYQNEYEYLDGPATRDRCHNTVQNIMNWYQLAQSPTWYWIHALKPCTNSEASGYALGYWMPLDPSDSPPEEPRELAYAVARRCSDDHLLKGVSDPLIGTYCLTVPRGDGFQPASSYEFSVSKPCEVYLLAHERGGPLEIAGWEKTDYKTLWSYEERDAVYRRTVGPGVVRVPSHTGKLANGYYGVPHAVLVRAIDGVECPIAEDDLPIGASVELLEKFTPEEIVAELEPGHWTWNKYNWHSVVGFLKYMPWDSTVVKVTEEAFDHDMRILAFKRPDGKLVVVLSNRCWSDYQFQVDTQLPDAEFRGYRYTPDESGEGFMGVPVGAQQGPVLNATVPDLVWEFWVQQ